MHRTTLSYYTILEVDSKVLQGSIEAAYYRLARRYHPDLNHNQDAKSKMQEINEAYQVLRDPQKRGEYDLHLSRLTNTEDSQHATCDSSTPQSHSSPGHGQTTKPPPKTTREQPNSFLGATGSRPTSRPTKCEQCGRSDASLRYTTFPYVISIILVSLRRGKSGLYCSKCRKKKMNVAKLVSFFFGWWGIPFGIFYTLGALLAPGDGMVDAKLNADYLKWLGGHFIHTGRLIDAQRAIRSSLAFKHDPELAAAASALFGDNLVSKNSSAKRNTTATWVAVLVIGVMAIAVGIAVTNLSRYPRQRIAAALISQQTFTMDRLQPPSSPPLLPQPEEWTRFKSNQGNIELAYPTQWILNRDANQAIELTGLSTGVILIWSTNETDKSIRDIIANSETSPDFADNYFLSFRKYIEGEVKNEGGLVQRIDRPVVKQIGEYYTIYNEVTTSYILVPGTPKRDHFIHYLFDCGSYVCRMNFHKDEDDPFTVEQFQLAEQILASIKIAPPTPNAAAN